VYNYKAQPIILLYLEVKYISCIQDITLKINMAHGRVVVKALFYKPEGRDFDTRWGDVFKFT
jgi:hypothetical protein